jgi:hypothetical protein
MIFATILIILGLSLALQTKSCPVRSRALHVSGHLLPDLRRNHRKESFPAFHIPITARGLLKGKDNQSDLRSQRSGENA